MYSSINPTSLFGLASARTRSIGQIFRDTTPQSFVVEPPKARDVVIAPMSHSVDWLPGTEPATPRQHAVVELLGQQLAQASARHFVLLHLPGSLLTWRSWRSTHRFYLPAAARYGFRGGLPLDVHPDFAGVMSYERYWKAAAALTAIPPGTDGTFELRDGNGGLRELAVAAKLPKSWTAIAILGGRCCAGRMYPLDRVYVTLVPQEARGHHRWGEDNAGLGRTFRMPPSDAIAFASAWLDATAR